MNLIALKDFRNVPSLEIKLKDGLHDNHIHKGALFSIGSANELAKCTKPNQETIAHLILAGCVGSAEDPKVVEAVKAEVAADEKREKAAAKVNAAANDSALVAQLIAMLKGGEKKAA